jgi:mediator of RNA polymerase II transcription subunit 12, fungi type
VGYIGNKSLLHVLITLENRENVFKLPARVTLAGDKRIQWYTDLANPKFPLQKLGKTVPHGKKDQELLELLFSNKTPVDRAVWYIRCLGAIEIVSYRL